MRSFTFFYLTTKETEIGIHRGGQADSPKLGKNSAGGHRRAPALSMAVDTLLKNADTAVYKGRGRLKPVRSMRAACGVQSLCVTSERRA